MLTLFRPSVSRPYCQKALIRPHENGTAPSSFRCRRRLSRWPKLEAAVSVERFPVLVAPAGPWSRRPSSSSYLGPPSSPRPVSPSFRRMPQRRPARDSATMDRSSIITSWTPDAEDSDRPPPSEKIATALRRRRGALAPPRQILSLAPTPGWRARMGGGRRLHARDAPRLPAPPCLLRLGPPRFPAFGSEPSGPYRRRLLAARVPPLRGRWRRARPLSADSSSLARPDADELAAGARTLGRLADAPGAVADGPRSARRSRAMMPAIKR